MNVFGATFYFLMVGVCAACGEGFFSGSSGKCIKCAERCTTCVSSVCYKCALGRFGKYCENVCNYCLPSTNCTREGFCLVGCKDGLSGNHCNVSCDSRCQSCDRHHPEICVQCKNNQSCDLNQSCPVNCQGHRCYGNYCTEGCPSGSWGQSCQKYCPEKCSSVGCDRQNGTCHKVSTDTEQSASPSAFEVIVPILSVSLIITLGVVIFKLFLKRKPRHRGKKKVIYQPQHATDRNNENCLNPKHTWEFDNDSFENYANAQKTGAKNNSNRRAKEPVDVVTCEYSIPGGTVERKQVADIEELDERCVSEEIKLAATIDVEDTYYNTMALRERQISVQALAEYVNQMSDEDYNEEFERLPSILIKPCNEALREENVLKNRYRGIYPYDVTRVIISSKTSDYINANYIDGYNERRGYIASVGPTIKFMGDMSVFWRVVWQENCRTIVMLTRLVESEVIKCDEYWPDKNCAKCFGNFCITSVEEEKCEAYATRTLKMERFQSIGDTEGAETRTIRQFHYLAWPDKGLPENASSLIDLLDAVNATRVKGDGPILVHCSAGIGRTGTFIALDILTKEAKATGHVDIYACVRNLREQRVKMVQTMAQYKFLHHVLVYSFGKRDSSKTPAFSTRL